ncbi:MAG TPA: hypothetical protein VN381_00835, partial [Anaerovoracaceae bacterium]|nr:hypothetical protein [Anaerovoracaceae bacterium]
GGPKFMQKLFAEFRIKDLTLKNRIAMPPMCMYCASDDGMATRWHLVHYATRAVSGTGLIIDSVNVSTGGLVPVKPRVFNGYQIPHAETIREMTGLPVTAGGLLTDPKEIDDILNQNKADLVFLGRELLRNPYWALQAAKELEADQEWPKQYERAK